ARKFTDDLHLYHEAACDLQTAEEHGRLDVAETLLRVQRLAPQGVRLDSPAMIAAFNGPEVEDRIKLLLENSVARQRKFRPLLYVVMLAVLSLLMVDPLHHGAEWVLLRLP
ncbi:MAG TPA: hypothetical protein VMH83_04525, partial [Candidatus Acidoferrum sp.]|nr:hypothetical protein [Candidatus Acidoferrum sp.]